LPVVGGSLLGGGGLGAIVAIQNFAVAHSDSLLELDVNPLLIGAQGEGVFAADALIVIQEQDNV